MATKLHYLITYLGLLCARRESLVEREREESIQAYLPRYIGGVFFWLILAFYAACMIHSENITIPATHADRHDIKLNHSTAQYTYNIPIITIHPWFHS